MREQKVTSRVAAYWPRSREKGGFTCDEEQSSLLSQVHHCFVAFPTNVQELFYEDATLIDIEHL